MDTLPDNAWSSAFENASTRPVLTALQRRLQASNCHVHALAELFHERAVIENEYATKLGKLVRAAEAGQLNGKGGVEWDRHGGEAKLWDTVLSDIQETASAHLSLSSSLKSDFEQPIREMPGKIVPWRQIHDQETSLDRTLKDAEKTHAKLDKASTKKSAKTDQLASDLNQLNSTLSSLSPRVFQTFQRLDEERLRSIKEVVVRWATARADVATRDQERAEASLTRLLGWETNSEVLAVGNRIASASGGRPSIAAPPTSTAVVTTPRRPSMQNHGSSSDLTPKRANGSTSEKSGFSGLKSMLARKATVSGRQRSGSEATSMRSNRRAPTDEVFAPLDEGDDESDVRSRDSHARALTPQRQLSDRNVPTAPAAKSSMVDSEGYSIAPADRHRNPWEEPNEDIPSTSNAGVALPSAIFAEQRTSTPDTSRPSSVAGSVDAAGHSRLNLSLASAPIQESEEERTAALAKMQQTLQATPGAPVRRTTIARGRREARNTMQAESAAMQPHLAKLANMGNMAKEDDREQLTDEQPSIPPMPPMPTQARRPSVSSISSSRNPFDSPSLHSPQASLSSPVVPGAMGAGAATAAGAAGAAAFASPTSSEPTSAALTSPATTISPTTLSGPPVPAKGSSGLQANFVETIHALIKQFNPLQVAVSGEVHVSYTDAPAAQPVHIRLTGFDALESIAPNPAFLAQVPDTPGEYYLDTQLLSQACAEGSPTLFKYVVAPGEIPLALNPAFQVRDGETRMILHYKSSNALQNLNLSVLFPSSPAVTNTQSKPISSSWRESPEGKIAYWEPTISAGEEGKVVARFVTAAGSQLAPLGVSAHFSMPHLLSGLGIQVVDDIVPLQVGGSTVAGKYVGDFSA